MDTFEIVEVTGECLSRIRELRICIFQWGECIVCTWVLCTVAERLRKTEEDIFALREFCEDVHPRVQVLCFDSTPDVVVFIC